MDFQLLKHIKFMKNILQTKFIFYQNIIIVVFLRGVIKFMRKIIFLIVIEILILSGFGVNGFNNDDENIYSETLFSEYKNFKGEDFTHTVFLEIGNTQFCGGCDFWNSDVYELYSKDDYDFEYVNMIVYGPDGWDDILNNKAFVWNNLYNITKYPTSILDGEYRRLNYQPYTLPIYIDECGSRDVRDISAELMLNWLGNATIKIDIRVENNENKLYNGYIRTAITEITSRYITVFNSSFNFGFLDYAFNKNITIPANDVYTDSINWNGNEHMDNHGSNFGDIKPDNIQVVMGVFNNLNNYVDETVKAYINNPPESPNIDGPNSGKQEEEYEFSIVSEDPYDNDLFYFVKWGDETFEDWFGPFKSGEIVTINHNWSNKGLYNIKARAKTVNGLISLWGEFEFNIPRSRISIYNCLYRFLEKLPCIEVLLRIMIF